MKKLELNRIYHIVKSRKLDTRRPPRVEKHYGELYNLTVNQWLTERKAKRYWIVEHGRQKQVDGLYTRAAATEALSKWTDRLDAKRVLEVGSGMGYVIGSIAQRHSNVECVGIEPSESGVRASAQYWKKGKLEFKSGNGLSLPFRDKEFDISFTNQVLEQNPRSYLDIVNEMKRVAKFCIFIEEFYEAQRSLADIVWLYYKDYFRWSYKKLPLESVHFESMPSKVKYGLGLFVGKS